MKLALPASLLFLPPLATTSLVQDVWLVHAHEQWKTSSPFTYWTWTFVALGILVWVVRRRRDEERGGEDSHRPGMELGRSE